VPCVICSRQNQIGGATVTSNVHKNLMTFGLVGFEISSRTDKHTDTLVAILRRSCRGRNNYTAASVCLQMWNLTDRLCGPRHSPHIYLYRVVGHVPVVGRFVYLYCSRVETICKFRAEGCGRPGGATVCNDVYHFNISMNWEIRQ